MERRDRLAGLDVTAADAADLEGVTRTVARAVQQRLGKADPDVVELVVREVLAVLPEAGATSAASATSAGTSPAGPTRNADGTMTTGLGAVLPWPQAAMSLPTCASCVEQERRSNQNRAIVTATGPNRRGVIATLTQCIADADGDIQDVSQTIISDFFTLIFVVDLRQMAIDFADFKQRVCAAAEALGIHAVVMHEDVMRALQRV